MTAEGSDDFRALNQDRIAKDDVNRKTKVQLTAPTAWGKNGAGEFHFQVVKIARTLKTVLCSAASPTLQTTEPLQRIPCQLCGAWILPLLLLASPVAAEAQYTYMTNSEGTVSSTGYAGSADAVTIPSTINALPVTSIEGYTFYGAGLTNVTIRTA